MTSINAAAAIAVVAVIVVAAGAFVLLNNNDGNGGNTSDVPASTIGTTVEINDSYVLSSVYSSSSARQTGSAENITYTVIEKNGDNLTVSKVVEDQSSNSSLETTEYMTTSEFLDDVSVVDGNLIGQYERNETITTKMGTIDCMIYRDQQVVGNTTTVTTYDWIGVGTNIIYKTQISITSQATTETYTTTLYNTNMIDQGQSGGVEIPETPQTSVEIRTELEVGDYIEFSKREGNDRDYERITIVDIRIDTVYYREYGDDDIERTTVDDFLGLVIYSQGGTPVGTETISTVFGDKSCNVYVVDFWFSQIFDADWEDQVRVWAEVGTNTIYKFEIAEDVYDDDWHDWHDDIESYYLTGTSLMGAATGGDDGSSSQPSDPTTSSNRYGITLTVGDSFTITENGWGTETYEIISIDGNRLTIKETSDRGRVEIDQESANEFISEFMMTADELNREWESLNQSESIGGHNCQVYQERYDDDRDRIWVQQVGSNYIVWQEAELGWNGQIHDAETLTSLNIQTLSY